MPKVNFTSALKRFFPQLKEIQVEAENLQDVLYQLEASFPGLKDYIVDESGVLRQHVNIFINGELLHKTDKLDISISQTDEIFILQALSGG